MVKNGLPCSPGEAVSHEQAAISGRQRRGTVLVAASLLVASTVLFTASTGSRRRPHGADELL
jgi:hypothetical protein